MGTEAYSATYPEGSNKEVTEDKCQKFFRMTSFVLK